VGLHVVMPARREGSLCIREGGTRKIEEQGECSMSPGPILRGRQSTALVRPNWRQQLGEWRDLLVQCARKPSRKRVHALRSLTLRLSATLRFQLVDQPQEPAALRALRRWTKEGKRLRRTLEPVRDSDVYLARLSALQGELTAPAPGKRRLTPRCQREIETLVSKLMRRRKKGIDELVATLAVQSKQLVRLSEEMEAELKLQIPLRIESTAQPALRIFAELAGELPHLGAANLHAFRKHLKRVLYLAEISAAFDPEAGRLVTMFRKMHGATGDWHDWQTLALKARRILPGSKRSAGLVPMLERLANESLNRTLDLSRAAVEHIFKTA